MASNRYNGNPVMLTLLLVVAASWLCAYADTDTSERIFDSRFRTVKTQVADNFMSPPVIRLGTDDRLVINFDEIGEDHSDLQYRLIHCNAGWQPSRLVESEYVDGFNFRDIEDYAFSSSTFVHYVNYQIEIPDPEMPIIHSGNYLLQVFDRDDPDRLILQTRFMVAEPYLSVAGNYTSRTDRGHNTEWQQPQFVINTENMELNNPYTELIVSVSQNGREAMTRRIPAPMRVDGRNLVYEHLADLVFPASNEYRRFESVSNYFPGMHVDSLHYGGSNYHVWLKPDEDRAFRDYQYDRTQHGRFLVKEYNASDSNIGADYITVHFALVMPELPGIDVFIDGEFTHGRYGDSNRMRYNREAGRYECQMPLKQGAYNYQYVTRRQGSEDIPTASTVEGNKYETDNEYQVAVYYRPVAARGDRLVGFAVLGY